MRIGSTVTKCRPGDLAAVGGLVDSDRTCPHYQAKLENFCPNQNLTFNSPDKHLGRVTYGGYSESVAVDEHFVLRVSPNLEISTTQDNELEVRAVGLPTIVRMDRRSGSCFG